MCNPGVVKLLEAEPTIAPAAAPAPPVGAPPAVPEPAAPTRPCTACGAEMALDQDWCLTCGTAAPGRLGERPGWRAASNILLLTLLLVLGAVGASYAALTDDPDRPAPAPGPVAQVPATAPPGAQPPATPAPDAGAPADPLPSVKTPAAPAVKPASVAPVTPAPSSGTTRSAPPARDQTKDGPSGGEAAPAAPKLVELEESAGTIYDPYGRGQLAGKTERALDGDKSTSWYVDVPQGERFGVGYAIDLGDARGVRRIDIRTPTPGFGLEVYATDEDELPPDILDTRWAHLKDVKDVGADGVEKIVLGAGTSKYRHLQLWITTPPSEGRRVRITELALFQ